MTSPTAVRLVEMIELATVDCYNDSEQVCGLFTMLDDALALPFETTILGAPVTVTEVELTVDDRIMAVLHHDGNGQRVPLLDLPLPTPPPAGWEWIAAYRRWAAGTAGHR